MAELLKLPTELILAITSHIPRSADKLHFALIDRELYSIIIPELYTHILLDRSANLFGRGGSTQIHGELCLDVVRLCRLARVLNDTSSSFKLTVKSLSLEFDSDTLHQSLFYSNIMLCLPSLKSLCLRGKILAEFERYQDVFKFSPGLLGRSLRPVRKTLETLIIDIDQDKIFRTGQRFATLVSFPALKHLSIQSHVFFGDRDDDCHHTQTGGVNVGLDMSSLASFLPPKLRKLQMNCWTDGERGNKHYWGPFIAAQLEFLLNSDLGEWLTDLRDITIYYLAKDRNPNHVHERLTLMAGEQDLEVDKSECIRYAAEGRWQELAKTLTEMAARENRNLIVKFKEASQM